MGLLDRLRAKANSSDDLLGVWHLVRSETLEHKDAELEIHDDGRMTYSIREGAAWQVMKLTYRVDDGYLVSNQPSAPREERTRFSLESDGTLMLALGGERSWFERGLKRVPV